MNPSGSCIFNGYLADENYFSDCGGGGSSSSTSNSSIIDTVYSGSLSCTNTSSDTVTIPYINGRDIFVSSTNLTYAYSGFAYLRIVDDNGVDISTKVTGSQIIRSDNGNGTWGIAITSIGYIATVDDPNIIQAIIRPYNLNTSNLYIFFDVTPRTGWSGGASGTVSFQY